jgi:dienelactone hydrolase
MDDVVAAVALLAARKEIDAGRIVIVGHSLGGTVAPRIAAGGHGIAGVVIMAGASRPLPVLLVEQVEYLATLNGPPDEAALRRIAEIKSDAARAMAAQPGDTGAKILGASPTYWADLNAYDPASAAAQLSVPLLILQGGRDYQVRTADLQRFKAALAEHPNATIREFPKLNHLFMAGEGKSRPEDYRIAGHVDGDVIETLAQFVAGVKK